MGFTDIINGDLSHRERKKARNAFIDQALAARETLVDQTVASVGPTALAALGRKSFEIFHKAEWSRFPLHLPDIPFANALKPPDVDALFPQQPGYLTPAQSFTDSYEETHFKNHPIRRPASLDYHGDALTVTCGIRRWPRPSQEVIAEGLDLYSKTSSPRVTLNSSRSIRRDVYPTHIVPFVPLDENTTSTGWAQETFSRLCALRARSTYPEKYSLEAMADPVMYLAPRLVNTTPEELIPPREIVMDEGKKGFYEKIKTVFGEKFPPEAIWFLLKNSDSLTSDMLEDEAIKGPLGAMATCLGNGLVVDRLHELFQKGCAKGSTPLQALVFSLRVISAIYGNKYNYVYGGRNYGHETWWFKENMDLTACFDEGVSESGECGGNFCLAWDGKGMEVMAGLAEAAQVVFEPTLALYKAGGYRIERFSAPSLRERYECLAKIVRWYGIGNLSRALRVFEFAEGVLEDAPEAQAGKALENFVYYLDKQRPENSLVGCLEGDEATIYIPGVSGLRERGEQKKKPMKTDLVQDSTMSASELSGCLGALTRPLSHRRPIETAVPALPPDISSELLFFPADEVTRASKPKLLGQRDLPISLNGLAGLFGFYEPYLRANYNPQALPEEIFYSYWRFLAEEMPDPFAPPFVFSDRYATGGGYEREKDPFITFLRGLVTHVKVDWCAYTSPPPADSREKQPQPVAVPGALEGLKSLLQLWATGFLNDEKLAWILPTLADEKRTPSWERERWVVSGRKNIRIQPDFYTDRTAHDWRGDLLKDPRPLLQKRYEGISGARAMLMSQRTLVELGFITEAQWQSLGESTLLHGERNCGVSDFIPKGETSESLAPWLRLLVHEGFLDPAQFRQKYASGKGSMSVLWEEAARFKQALTVLKRLEQKRLEDLMEGGYWDGPEQIEGITVGHYSDFLGFVGMADGWRSGLVINRQFLEYIFYAYSPLFTVLNLLCEQHRFPLTRDSLRRAIVETPSLFPRKEIDSSRISLLTEGVALKTALALEVRTGKGGAIDIHRPRPHLEGLLGRLSAHYAKGARSEGTYGRSAPDLIRFKTRMPGSPIPSGVEGIREIILLRAGLQDQAPSLDTTSASCYISSVTSRLQAMMSTVAVMRHVEQLDPTLLEIVQPVRGPFDLEMIRDLRERSELAPSNQRRLRAPQSQLLDSLDAFYSNHPKLKEKICEARRLAFGLVPIGAKVHFSKPVNEEILTLVMNRFGLKDSNFKLERSNKCLILFAVPSAGELELILECLSSFGLSDDDSAQLQLCLPGWLSQRDAGMLTSTLLLSKEVPSLFTADSFKTTQDEKTGARIVARHALGYHASPLFFMPPHPYNKQRMDVLLLTTFSEFRIAQDVGTALLMDRLNFGLLRKFWPIQGEGLSTQFEKDYLTLLKSTRFKVGIPIEQGGSLVKVLDANWYYENPDAESQDDIGNQAHFDGAVDPCVQAYFDCMSCAEKTGDKTGIVFGMRESYLSFRTRLRQAQMALLSSGKARQEADVLLNFKSSAYH